MDFFQWHEVHTDFHKTGQSVYKSEARHRNMQLTKTVPKEMESQKTEMLTYFDIIFTVLIISFKSKVP